MRFLLFITLPLYALDQLTKWLVVRNIDEGDGGYAVIAGFFNVIYATNTGVAFSAFTNKNAYFIVLSICVLAGLVFFYRRGAFRGGMLNFGFSLLVAGILGNLTDRILRHHVIDFLSFDLHVRFANPWPTFNVADSCICVAAAIFVFASFQEETKSHRQR